MTSPTPSLLTGLSVDSVSASDLSEAAFGTRRPNAIAETVDRRRASANAVAVTGQAIYSGIYLLAGQKVSNITFVSGTTALATGTHQVFGLHSPTFGLLGQSADATSSAWAASTEKTLALATPYTVTTEGLYYVSVAVVASTMPTLAGTSGLAALQALAPVTGFTDTGNTIVATLPATATVSAGFAPLFAYVS